MKGITIRMSRKKEVTYLMMHLGMLVFCVYAYTVYKENHPDAKPFYWPAIVIFGLGTLYSIYNLIDKTPLYVLDEKGIHKGRFRKTILWKDLYSFKSEVVYSKYNYIKKVSLFDQMDKKIMTIDLTHSDMTIERLEVILKKKLKQKGKVEWRTERDNH